MAIGPIGVGFVCFSDRLLMRRVVALLVCSLALAGFSFSIQSQASKSSTMVALAQSGRVIDCEFKISAQPIIRESFGQSVQMSQASVFLDQQALSVELHHQGALKLEKGATYSAKLKFSKFANHKKINFRAITVDEPVAILGAGSNVFQEARQAFVAATSSVDAESKALVLGLAIGDRSQTPIKLAVDMKTVSLTHLMAVSGANCAIVAGVVVFLLSKLQISRLIRALLTSLAIFAYVSLVGPEPSVIRAGFMAITVVMALSAGRKPHPIAALGFAVLCLLIADPWLAVDYGFLLSVAATAGILVLTPAIYSRLSLLVPKYLALAIAVSLGPQVFCLPILLQLQPGLSTYSVLANVLAEPLVAPVTVLAILACAVAWCLPGLSMALTHLASLGTWCIAQLAHFFAALPLATLQWLAGLSATIVSVLVILVILVWLKSRANLPKFLAAIALVIVLASTLLAQIPIQKLVGQWPPKNWQVVQCDVGQGDALVLRSSNAVAVIDVGREPKPIDDCLKELSVTKIDLLVLTHFDLDHVGGLDGALVGRSVVDAIISPFDDPRWAANKSLDRLEAMGANITVAGEGTSGKLGQVGWRVIGPAIPSSQIEDSNDGSLVISWDFASFSVLSMADSGERAQQFVAAKSLSWLKRLTQVKPLILKVSHHGSADQYGELIEELKPDLSLISVGAGNAYGHPTSRTLGLLERLGSKIFRTDLAGSIAITFTESGIQYSTSGRG